MCVIVHNSIRMLFLISIQIAEKIRPTVDKYQQAFPALLEIPSKDHPYGTLSATVLKDSLTIPNPDPSKDSVLKRVQKLFGE
jgi:V-type H+-transporting ATPase subunit F